MLDAHGAAVVLRAATATEIRAAAKTRAAKAVRVAPADTAYTGLPTLAETG